MADVDFSHAVLDVRTNAQYYPMSIDSTMLLENSNLHDASGSVISNGTALNRLLDTPSKVSFLYTGTFTTSGTEFYIGGDASYVYQPWKVSSISFSSGDTYSFIIDIEVSGS